jgi:hypothetical protein
VINDRLHRLRRARGRDLLLIARLLVWALLVPMLKRLVPLPNLARLMWVDRPSGTPNHERQKRIIRAARLVLRARPLGQDENCLDRSLVLYRFLSMEMLDPRLVVGVRRGPDAVKGHAWVTVDGRPVVEPSVAEYTPLAVIGPAGVVEVVREDGGRDVLASLGARR